MPEDIPWTTGRKVAFRFACSYLALYLYPLSATLGWFWFFWVRWESHAYEWPWRQLVPWVSTHVLRFSHPVTVANSLDSTYAYVKVFCLILVATVATVIWSVLDRNRQSYSRFQQWARWYVRLVLAYTMIGYGCLKVVPVQMPPPNLVTLMQPYGELTPGRHMWTFMGIFPRYEVFCGLVETTAGVLLLVPGLTTVGALLALVALGNVLTLSGFYDVAVKLGVAHLALLAVFLLAPDVPRLIQLLVLNRPVTPPPRRPLLRPAWLDRVVWGAQWAVGLSLIVMMLSNGAASLRKREQIPTTNPVYGIWRVQEFALDGEVRPPLLTDSLRWQRVIFDDDQLVYQTRVASIQGMDGDYFPFVVKVDSANRKLSVASPDQAGVSSFDRQMLLQRHPAGPPMKADLSYERPSPDSMILEGTLNGHRLRAALKREDRQFVLMTRGLHWVIEDDDFAF